MLTPNLGKESYTATSEPSGFVHAKYFWKIVLERKNIKARLFLFLDQLFGC